MNCSLGTVPSVMADYNLPLHIAAIFIVLASSVAGVCVPLMIYTALAIHGANLLWSLESTLEQVHCYLLPLSIFLLQRLKRCRVLACQSLGQDTLLLLCSQWSLP